MLAKGLLEVREIDQGFLSRSNRGVVKESQNVSHHPIGGIVNPVQELWPRQRLSERLLHRLLGAGDELVEVRWLAFPSERAQAFAHREQARELRVRTQDPFDLALDPYNYKGDVACAYDSPLSTYHYTVDNVGNRTQVIESVREPGFVPTPFTLYLHGTGPNANPPTLFLNTTAPTSGTAKYKDSPSINFADGNPWKDVGTWDADPAQMSGSLDTLGELRVWLGLKNSDDQGTRFDLRAEVYQNGELITAGETYCITGVTRNANQAKEVAVAFPPFSTVNFDGLEDMLSLKVLVRIGTNGSGAFCGGHSNAVGIRLYFDAVSRPAKFATP